MGLPVEVAIDTVFDTCRLHDLRKSGRCLAFIGRGIVEHDDVGCMAMLYGRSEGEAQSLQFPKIDFFILRSEVSGGGAC